MGGGAYLSHTFTCCPAWPCTRPGGGKQKESSFPGSSQVSSVSCTGEQVQRSRSAVAPGPPNPCQPLEPKVLGSNVASDSLHGEPTYVQGYRHLDISPHFWMSQASAWLTTHPSVQLHTPALPPQGEPLPSSESCTLITLVCILLISITPRSLGF